MDENELTKTELWTKRIHSFRERGLSRKEWCQEHHQEHQIQQSTFSYWIQKQTKEHPRPEQLDALVLQNFLPNKKSHLTYQPMMCLSIFLEVFGLKFVPGVPSDLWLL